MSSVISSLSDYFTGREVGTEVSLGKLFHFESPVHPQFCQRFL